MTLEEIRLHMEEVQDVSLFTAQDADGEKVACYPEREMNRLCNFLFNKLSDQSRKTLADRQGFLQHDADKVSKKLLGYVARDLLAKLGYAGPDVCDCGRGLGCQVCTAWAVLGEVGEAEK